MKVFASVCFLIFLFTYRIFAQQKNENVDGSCLLLPYIFPNIVGIKPGIGFLNFSLQEISDDDIGYWSQYQFYGRANHIGIILSTDKKLFLRYGIEYHFGKVNAHMDRFYHDSRFTFSTVTGQSNHDTLVYSATEPMEIRILKGFVGIGYLFLKEKIYLMIGFSPSYISGRSSLDIYTVLPEETRTQIFAEAGWKSNQFALGISYKPNLKYFMVSALYYFLL